MVRDFFQVRPRQPFNFPPLKAVAPDYSKVEVRLPDYDGIVGNFPYVRQELIERQVKGYKKQIVEAVAIEWFWKDQSLFKMKDISKEEINQVYEYPASKRDQWIRDQVREGRIDLGLSGQADIYAYLFYHATAFMKEGARLGIVTSNSWLDVAYGIELKRFFLRHFNIVAVVASWCEPWFEDAAINTAFVVLERCENPEERAKNFVRFVKVKKPLRDLLPDDLHFKEPERWKKVDALVREIETAGLKEGSNDESEARLGIRTFESDNFRIRLVPQSLLEIELESKGEAAKWGTYIRAPQVYFDILERAGDKFVPLGEVAEVRFGIKTGINEFFYLKPSGKGDTSDTIRVENKRGWVGEIEKACLLPVIRSPKEADGVIIDSEKLSYRLFLPRIDPGTDDPEEKLRSNYPLAYRYVKWGERQRTNQGQPWPEVPSVKGRKAWWLLPYKEPGRILMPMTSGQRFAVFENKGAMADHRLFELLVSEEQTELVSALMNSTLFALIRETVSRVNLGDGATETEGIDWKKSVLIPSPLLIDASDANTIKAAYDEIRLSQAGPIQSEVKRKERQKLDRAILKALGLNPDIYLPSIYQGLLEMVEERHKIPKLRSSRKKQEQRVSLENIKEKILNEVLANGLKPIDAFLPSRNTPMMNIPISSRPVEISAFFTHQKLLDANGKLAGEFEGVESQARYAIYAAQPGAYMVKVPIDPRVAEKASRDYEEYLKKVAQELLQHALDATRNHRQADRVVHEILESLPLPGMAISKIRNT